MDEVLEALKNQKQVSTDDITRANYWDSIRPKIVEYAHAKIDGNEHSNAMFALNEVKRLDIFVRDLQD